MSAQLDQQGQVLQQSVSLLDDIVSRSKVAKTDTDRKSVV